MITHSIAVRSFSSSSTVTWQYLSETGIVGALWDTVIEQLYRYYNKSWSALGGEAQRLRKHIFFDVLWFILVHSQTSDGFDSISSMPRLHILVLARWEKQDNQEILWHRAKVVADIFPVCYMLFLVCLGVRRNEINIHTLVSIVSWNSAAFYMLNFRVSSVFYWSPVVY